MDASFIFAMSFVVNSKDELIINLTLSTRSVFAVAAVIAIAANTPATG